ncbi:MAG: acyltransferase [Acidimicrobiales bacterium]|jgi:peptidoglycan/LPS O-acetylase OafA/YrhL|nr:acyltransferase [Acidimicrobiales bacterium]
MEFLDGLRGVAALAVLVQHGSELLWPSYFHWSETVFRLGECGMVVFFLVSGFIIPGSIERYGSLARFWIGRFFRLFPMYWVAVTAGLALHFWFGRYWFDIAHNAHPLRGTILNFTMVQQFLHTPSLIGSTWTLAYEMVFYGFASALFLTRLHRRPVPVAGLWIALALWAGLVFRPFLVNRAETLWFASLLFMTMFVGSVLSSWVRGKVPGATALIAYLGGIATVILVCHAQIDPHPVGVVPGIAHWTTEAATLVGAYLVFGAALLVRKARVPQPLLWLGTVSYSLYLLHPLVYGSVPQFRHHPVWTLATWLAVTIAISGLTYRVVELPFHELGRRIGRAPASTSRHRPIRPVAGGKTRGDHCIAMESVASASASTNASPDTSTSTRSRPPVNRNGPR